MTHDMTDERRQGFVAASRSFTLQTAGLRPIDKMADGFTPDLDVEWRNGIPLVGRGSTYRERPEVKVEGCYVGSIAATLTADQTGQAHASLDRADLIEVLDGQGSAVITEHRIILKLDYGQWCGQEVASTDVIAVNLDRNDIQYVELVSSVNTGKPAAVVFGFHGSCIGRLTFEPEFGLNSPWTPQDRGVWRERVVEQCFEDATTLITGGDTFPGVSCTRSNASLEVLSFLKGL